MSKYEFTPSNAFELPSNKFIAALTSLILAGILILGGARLAGEPDKSIAFGLNTEGLPCTTVVYENGKPPHGSDCTPNP